MTALTAKAACTCRWSGTVLDPRNDSFDGQSCLKGWLGAVLDPLEMTALTAKAGSPGSLRNDSFDGQSCLALGFEGLAGQSWIP